MNDAMLVATGAVPGAWLRFRIVNHLEPMLPRKHWGTFGVNVIACFSLGLLATLEAHTCAEGGMVSDRTMLLLGTGFLGSLSTFSTFMGELFVTVQSRQWREGLLVCGGSVLLGLAALVAGITVGS